MQLARGALRAGVEVADRLDLVAEKLHSQRVGVCVGKNINDAPAAGKVAGHLDLVAFLETALAEPPDELVRIERLPYLNG